MLRFLHIPKTAGMSICQAIKQPSGHKPLLAKSDSDYIFTCVRNPYDRAVSLFYFMNQKCPAFCERFRPKGEPINDFWVNYKGGVKFMQTQVSWMAGVGKFDKIIRFEDIKSEWQELQDAHNLPDLKHINKSSHQHWQDELNNEAIKAIGEIYADDFEHLGYERL